MGNVVHFVSRNDGQFGPLQVVLDHSARGRGRLRWYDECFAHDLSQIDGVMPGKAVVAGEHDDEWLRNHTPVNQIVRPLFRPHERGVKPAPHQGVSEVRGILARDRDLYIGQFIVKDAHRFRQPIYFLPRETP